MLREAGARTSPCGTSRCGIGGGVGNHGGMERAGGGAGALQPAANTEREDDEAAAPLARWPGRGAPLGMAACEVASHRACARVVALPAKAGGMAGHPSDAAPAAAATACSLSPGG